MNILWRMQTHTNTHVRSIYTSINEWDMCCFEYCIICFSRFYIAAQLLLRIQAQVLARMAICWRRLQNCAHIRVCDAIAYENRNNTSFKSSLNSNKCLSYIFLLFRLGSVLYDWRPNRTPPVYSTDATFMYLFMYELLKLLSFTCLIFVIFIAIIIIETCICIYYREIYVVYVSFFSYIVWTQANLYENKSKREKETSNTNSSLGISEFNWILWILFVLS